MPGDGPSWWQMRTVPAPNLDPGSSNADSTYFLIFESFEKNAHKHAILRAAVTNGVLSLEGAYSHDEIFSTSKFARSPTEFAEKMRAVIDDVENNAVTVETDACGPHRYALRINLGSDRMDVTLHLKDKIDEKTFLDRLMTYLSHVECKRRMEEECLERRQRKRDTLKALVDDAVNRKLDENRKLETGLRTLMTEKRNHWNT